MRILFIDSTHPELPTLLNEQGHECDLLYNESDENILKIMPQYDGWVIRSRFKLDKKLIDLGNELKFIARVGAGMENINVEYAMSKGIACLHAPQGNANAVAEHVLAMLLCLFRKINKADKEVRDGIWLREENRGVELDGKTIGVIGYGNMGKAFVKKLKGFDCKVLVYDKYLTGFGKESIIETDLAGIFAETDVLSLHVPQTKETLGMVDDVFLSSFKKSIYLINTARGKVLNTGALLNALNTGKVSGACLDVLEFEASSFEKIDKAELPLAFQHLIHSDKVVLTPHIAGWTHESNVKMARILAEKINEL